MNAVCEAKDERQVAWAWWTDLIHSFSLGHLLGQAEGQTIRGTSRDNGVVFAVMVKGRDWGPPRWDASSLLMEDSHPGLLSAPAGMNKTPPLESLSPTSLIPECR